MPANVEIKARIHSIDAVLPLAAALADEDHRPQLILQDDTFYSAPQGRLKLRVFADGSGELIHYLRPDVGGPKVSDYVIAPVTEPESLRQVLERACGQLGRVRKRRVLVLVGHTRIHLDEVEGLGSFLEIEVVLQPGQSEAEGAVIARSLMAALGVDDSALVSGAYVDLLTAPRPAPGDPAGGAPGAPGG